MEEVSQYLWTPRFFPALTDDQIESTIIRGKRWLSQDRTNYYPGVDFCSNGKDVEQLCGIYKSGSCDSIT